MGLPGNPSKASLSSPSSPSSGQNVVGFVPTVEEMDSSAAHHPPAPTTSHPKRGGGGGGGGGTLSKKRRGPTLNTYSVMSMFRGAISGLFSSYLPPSTGSHAPSPPERGEGGVQGGGREEEEGGSLPLPPPPPPPSHSEGAEGGSGGGGGLEQPQGGLPSRGSKESLVSSEPSPRGLGRPKKRSGNKRQSASSSSFSSMGGVCATLSLYRWELFLVVLSVPLMYIIPRVSRAISGGFQQHANGDGGSLHSILIQPLGEMNLVGGLYDSISSSLGGFSGGGGSSLPPPAPPPPTPASLWDTVQSHADCVATRGEWQDRYPDPQTMMAKPFNPDHSCGAPPWNFDKDPGHFYTYSGHPVGCMPPHPWNRTHFCRALKGRDLLLVGDSTTFTSHDSMLAALLDGPYFGDFKPLGHSQFDPCSGHIICGQEAAETGELPYDHPDKVLPCRLTFVRNDYLTLNLEYEISGDLPGTPNPATAAAATAARGSSAPSSPSAPGAGAVEPPSQSAGSKGKGGGGPQQQQQQQGSKRGGSGGDTGSDHGVGGEGGEGEAGGGEEEGGGEVEEGGGGGGAPLPDDGPDAPRRRTLLHAHPSTSTSTSSSPRGRRLAHGLLYPWVPLLHPNTILFMNRGAHYAPTDTVVGDLEKTLLYIRTHFPTVLTVFRNTVVGAEAWEGARLPLTHRPVFLPHGLGRKYNWDKFPPQNAAVRALFDRLRGPGGAFQFSPGGLVYLDVDNSTSLRPDHHKDPLHYCIPGPQDHWALLLQAVLEKANEFEVPYEWLHPEEFPEYFAALRGEEEEEEEGGGGGGGGGMPH